MTDTYYINPEDIVSDFLRRHITDPQDRSEDVNSESFTATSGQTDFSLTAPVGSVSCVTSITVDGTSKLKWLDYYWDYQNQKIIFFTGISVGLEVVINYKYGSTNWVYSDRPDQKLSADSYPRISVFTITGTGKRLGQYNAPFESVPVLQIDVWTKNGQIFTIDGRKYSNEYLGRYLAGQITKSFEKNESDLFPVLYNYNLTGGPRGAPYSEEMQCHHTIVEVQFKALRLGRIEVN